MLIWAAVVLTMGVFVLTGLFSKAFYGTMVGLTGGKDEVGLVASSFAGVLSSKGALIDENNNLKKRVIELENSLSDREIILKENNDLKAAVRYKLDTTNVLATVLSKPPFTPFDVMVVDAGSSQGIKIGDRVMIGQTYIGTITLVSSNSSQVTLLSSPGTTHEAYLGDDAQPVLLNGKGGGNFETSLPKGSSINVGDMVFAYYLQTPYYISSVTKKIENNDNTLDTILLNLPINLYSITHVEIIPS